jgi:hypothetical protein
MGAGAVNPQRSKKLGLLSIVTVPGWRKTRILGEKLAFENTGFALGVANSVNEH